jgi:hypothetical protein
MQTHARGATAPPRGAQSATFASERSTDLYVNFASYVAWGYIAPHRRGRSLIAFIARVE